MVSEEVSKVENGYNNIADEYLLWAQSQPSYRLRYTDKLLKEIPQSSRILELGCGAGVPVTQKVHQHVSPAGGTVVANDISERQIALARVTCPDVKFIHGDMTSLSFEPSSFDAVVSFYAIFHLPREQQKMMLELIYGWLRTGGWMVCNMSTVDDAGKTSNFLGTDMFWSSYDVEKSKAMFREVGFELVEAEVLQPPANLDPSDPDQGVEFLWILARRR